MIDRPPADTDFLYLDSSALVKLVLEEPESDALRSYVGELPIVSSALALTEVPRAVHRVVGDKAELTATLKQGRLLLERVDRVPLDEPLLDVAGAIGGAELRSLDAIHVASAITASLEHPFVSYDAKQIAAANKYSLMTASPA